MIESNRLHAHAMRIERPLRLSLDRELNALRYILAEFKLKMKEYSRLLENHRDAVQTYRQRRLDQRRPNTVSQDNVRMVSVALTAMQPLHRATQIQNLFWHDEEQRYVIQ